MMVKLFERIFDSLRRHRGLSALVLALLVVAGVALSFTVGYEEDIARFLPQSAEQADYQQAVEMLTNQNRIVVLFAGEEEETKQAMDAFEEHFSEVDTAGVVSDLQVTVDESQLMDMLAFVSANGPYFLTARDYQRMDSLLASEDYVAAQLTHDKQILSLPTAGVAALTLRQDPLHLFAPVLERLQQAGRNSRFRVADGYVFTRDGSHGLAFLSSPFGVSESARNAELASMLDAAIGLTEKDFPAVSISAVGGPLIAVGNANQIKHDSRQAIALSVVLILLLLLWHYRRLSDLLWIGASLFFGWLVAIAVIAVVKGSISVIVLGIGSVIIGIAVNYPLHYLDHLKETGDERQTLRDMVQPLLIGNVTTVSAFLCLMWLDAAAMRDLGLFGSLVLVGTILFVLVALPVFAKAPRRSAKVEQMESEHRSLPFLGGKPGGILFVVLTCVFAYYSLQLSFDSDIRHINYMTDAQRQDMELLASLSEDMSGDMAGLIPSTRVQQQRLADWSSFCQRHAGLADLLQQEAARQGFSDDAFAGFTQLLGAELPPQEPAYFEPVGRFMGGQHLLNARSVGSQLVEILSDNFNYVSFVCGFVVFVFLWLSFGAIELALLSFLPLAVGWIWILGLMQLLGVQFNIVNIILATFIFGQGDDYTIFITEGLVYEYATGRRRLASYQRSVLLSAVLMFIGIGTLIFARHPALRSLAEVTFIGMGTVVFMAYVLPPLVFRWLVRNRRPEPLQVSGKLPITLRRVAYSLFSMGFFLAMMYLFVLPYTWFYFHLGRVTEARKLKYHEFLQRLADFVIHRVPGVRFCLENRVGERFDKPAVVVCNHQSHLDLMCLMMLTPKLVFLTNDWVWHNPFYGMVVHQAEFYPVTDGIEQNLERLRALYERGYSICVFPEGTRSEDCRILRFHQGAFWLAQQLGADVLPVYLHGVGHVLPKRDFLLREGRIDVEIGSRKAVPATADLLRFTREMRHHYQAHYGQLCQQLETAEYWAPYQKYVHTYMHGYEE